MAKNRIVIYFGILMLIYCIVRLARNHTDNVFVSFYATDLLFIPVAGLFSLFFVRLIKRDKEIVVSWYQILLFVFFSSWYFEWCLPKQGYYVPDVWDVVMYFFGGIIFYFLQFRTTS